jgi:hypothetical protein
LAGAVQLFSKGIDKIFVFFCNIPPSFLKKYAEWTAYHIPRNEKGHVMKMTKIIVLSLLITTLSFFLFGCGVESNPNSETDTNIESQSMAISYGNNDCWFTGLYDETWVDPENPSSGEHVVGWYQCSDYFASPISVYATIEAEGNEKNWMIWQSGSSTYMVFVDGWYYYWRRWILNQTANYIFGNIELY